MLQQRSKASHREPLPLIVPAMLINAANPNLSGKREQFPHYGGSRKWRGDRGARCLQRAAQMASSPSSKTDRREGAEGRHTHSLLMSLCADMLQRRSWNSCTLITWNQLESNLLFASAFFNGCSNAEVKGSLRTLLRADRPSATAALSVWLLSAPLQQRFWNVQSSSH